jgi:hypothetical protein
MRHSNGKEISMNEFQKKVSEDYENTNSFIKNVKKGITDIGMSEK